MLLSILTCHLTDRRQSLARLMRRLVPQCCPDFGLALDWEQMLSILLHNQGLEFEKLGVEWLIDDTAKGVFDATVEGGVRPVTTGEKRNKLLARAKSDFVCSVDDDDMLDWNYVSRILGAIKENPDIDVVGMEGMLLRPGESQGKLFIHSIENESWSETPEAYLRYANHLNPIKRELALAAGFPHLVFAEDKGFSDRVKPMLKKQVHLKSPIYFYNTR